MTLGYLKRMLPQFIEAKRQIIQLLGSESKDPFWEKRRMDQMSQDLEEFITWIERNQQ